MRTKSKSRKHFHGTHKGCEIFIDRETDGTFYIIVKAKDGCNIYDGWAPRDVTTMRQAKAEALYGSCLKERPKAMPASGGPFAPFSSPLT